jgi:hypothetical protein
MEHGSEKGGEGAYVRAHRPTLLIINSLQNAAAQGRVCGERLPSQFYSCRDTYESLIVFPLGDGEGVRGVIGADRAAKDRQGRGIASILFSTHRDMY